MSDLSEAGTIARKHTTHVGCFVSGIRLKYRVKLPGSKNGRGEWENGEVKRCPRLVHTRSQPTATPRHNRTTSIKSALATISTVDSKRGGKRCCTPLTPGRVSVPEISKDGARTFLWIRTRERNFRRSADALPSSNHCPEKKLSEKRYGFSTLYCTAYSTTRSFSLINYYY